MRIPVFKISYSGEFCVCKLIALLQAPAKPLTEAEKMRKVISELVDTEHTYVRHLAFLMKVRSKISSCKLKEMT